MTIEEAVRRERRIEEAMSLLNDACDEASRAGMHITLEVGYKPRIGIPDAPFVVGQVKINPSKIAFMK